MGAASVAKLGGGGSVLAKWTLVVAWQNQLIADRIAAAGIVPQTGDLILATRNDFQSNGCACMKVWSTWETLTEAGIRSDPEPIVAVREGLTYDIYYLRFA